MKRFSTKAVKERRKALGLTLDDMATLTGLKSKVSYWQYETGKYKMKADMLPKLALALQCHIEDFYV